MQGGGTTETRFLLFGNNGKDGTDEFLFLMGLRTSERNVVSQDGITDPGQLVGQCAICFVVMRSRLDLGGPGSQNIRRLSGSSGQFGRPQHRSGPIGRQHGR